MKRSFIRGLWGVTQDFWDNKTKNFEFEKFNYNIDNCCATRRYDLNPWIENVIKNSAYGKINIETSMYVFGEDNYKYATSLGLKCIKIHDEPYKYHPVSCHWKHKLLVLKYAMMDFDEIIWLDYDCVLRDGKNIPPDFWEILGRKESFQASMVKYKRVQSNLRKEPELNKIQPNGGFVYIRNKSIPDKLLNIFDSLSTWTDEIAYAKYTDDFMDGFDMDKYWDLFEPLLCQQRTSIYRYDSVRKDIIDKSSCFCHGFRRLI